MKKIATIPGKIYCANVLKAPVVVMAVLEDGTTETIATLNKERQYTFIAMSAETLFSGGEIGKKVFPVPFNSAPALNGDGGGELTREQESALESVIDGSTKTHLPETPHDYVMTNGSTIELEPYTDTWNVAPRETQNVLETRVLYSPDEARTTPLIAVPDGVTLHWAGDEEPTWEAGKDYVIQLLQTAPSHIEARPFNTPQGAKLPEWLNKSFVAYTYAGTRVAVAANFEGQTTGREQFTGRKDDIIALAQELAAATFDVQTDGYGQFNSAYPKMTLYLKNATFEKETSAQFQFHGNGLDNHTVIAPRATFRSLETVINLFSCANGVVVPSAVFDKALTVAAFNKDALTRSNSGTLDVASASFQKTTAISDVFTSPPPKVFKAYSFNLRSLNDGASAFVTCFSPAYFNETWRESVLSLVYGPRLQVDESGAFVRDAEGKCIPTPVLKTDPVSGDPASREPEELTGRRFLPDDAADRPTGWGIQDFRVTKLNEQGAAVFDTNEDGSFKYSSTGHTFKLPLVASALPESMGGSSAYGADIAAALQELSARGWAMAWSTIHY